MRNFYAVTMAGTVERYEVVKTISAYMYSTAVWTKEKLERAIALDTDKESGMTNVKIVDFIPFEEGRPPAGFRPDRSSIDIDSRLGI